MLSNWVLIQFVSRISFIHAHEDLKNVANQAATQPVIRLSYHQQAILNNNF